MFIYTQLSAPNGFAKFGWQIRAICHKENEKSGSQSRVPQAIATEIFVRPDADHTAIISHMYVQHTNLNPSYLLSAIFIFMYTPCLQTNMRK